MQDNSHDGNDPDAANAVPVTMNLARIGTNSGHGFAWERPDGFKAWCGGPPTCTLCQVDAAMVERQKAIDEAARRQ